MDNYAKNCRFCTETQRFLLKKYGNCANFFEFPEFVAENLKEPELLAENSIEIQEIALKFVTFPSKPLKSLTNNAKSLTFSPFLKGNPQKTSKPLTFPRKTGSNSDVSPKSSAFSNENGSFLKELEKHLEETSFESQEFSIYQPVFSSEDEEILDFPQKFAKKPGFTEKMAHFIEDLWNYHEFLCENSKETAKKAENLQNSSLFQEKIKKTLENTKKPLFLIKKSLAVSQKPLENPRDFPQVPEKLAQTHKILNKPCIFPNKPRVSKEK